MLSREDFYMIKQMRQQGAYIVDIATQVGCSERTVRRYLDWPLDSPDTSCHLLRDSLNTGFQTGCWSSDDRCFRA